MENQPTNYVKPIIIGAIVIALGLIISQSMKQNSIEKQQKAEIAAEQAAITKAEAKESTRKMNLDWCLSDADEAYWSYIRLNGTAVAGKKDTWNASQYDWNEAQKRKDAKSDICFQQYGK